MEGGGAAESTVVSRRTWAVSALASFQLVLLQRVVRHTAVLEGTIERMLNVPLTRGPTRPDACLLRAHCSVPNVGKRKVWSFFGCNCFRSFPASRDARRAHMPIVSGPSTGVERTKARHRPRVSCIFSSPRSLLAFVNATARCIDSRVRVCAFFAPRTVGCVQVGFA